MSKQSVPPVVSNSEIEDYLKSLSMSDQFEILLLGARRTYEEAKIKHNLDPRRYPFSKIEKLRMALENLERDASKTKELLSRTFPPAGRTET